MGAPSGKHIHWRRDDAILERMARVERGWVARKTNVAIARDLGVDEKTVRVDLQRLAELWRERVGDVQEDLRAKKVAELDEVIRQALETAEKDDAYERGVLLGDRVGEKEIVRDTKGKATFKSSKTQALNVARQAIMDQAKLLGVVVDKAALTDADGKTMDLASLIARARENRERRSGSGTAE
jgi:hypothetical protein